MRNDFTFSKLIGSIRQIHGELSAQAGRAVNVSLTLRNWLIGCYIAEYELRGDDRAAYGDKLLFSLAGELSVNRVSNCNRRQLYRYLRFYRFYPQIAGTLSPQFVKLLPPQIRSEKVGAPSPRISTPPDTILNKLSYSHIDLLVDIDDEIKRVFYEIECIRGNWSVRELKRQINSLYYERSGLSGDKKKLATLAQSNAETREPEMTIRDPYIFEFLGLKSREVIGESHLEDRLLDKLQEWTMNFSFPSIKI